MSARSLASANRDAVPTLHVRAVRATSHGTLVSLPTTREPNDHPKVKRALRKSGFARPLPGSLFAAAAGASQEADGDRLSLGLMGSRAGSFASVAPTPPSPSASCGAGALEMPPLRALAGPASPLGSSNSLAPTKPMSRLDRMRAIRSPMPGSTGSMRRLIPHAPAGLAEDERAAPSTRYASPGTKALSNAPTAKPPPPPLTSPPPPLPLSPAHDPQRPRSPAPPRVAAHPTHGPASATAVPTKLKPVVYIRGHGTTSPATPNAASPVAVVPAAELRRIYRPRRHFRVVLHPRERAAAKSASSAAALSIDAQPEAPGSEDGDGDGETPPDAGSQTGSSRTSHSKQPGGPHHGGRGSNAHRAGHHGHRTRQGGGAAAGAAGTNGADGLVVGRPVQVNTLKEMAEKLLQYRRRTNYMAWRSSKSARSRRAAETRRRKLENLRIEIITKTRLVRDIHARYEKLYNARMTSALNDLAQQDKSLFELRSRLRAEQLEVQRECEDIRVRAAKRIRELRQECQVRHTDLAELSRAITELHELKRCLTEDPGFLDAQAAPLVGAIDAIQSRADARKTDLDAQCARVEGQADAEMREAIKAYVRIENNDGLREYFELVTQPLYVSQCRMARERDKQAREQDDARAQIAALEERLAELTRRKAELKAPKRAARLAAMQRHRALLERPPSAVVPEDWAGQSAAVQVGAE
ncbi:hypothetical protein H9P43_010004 [Blastocladiella emersonii ATCC 22665]|nr:hypothetical protein H9P43_010004 [Blastocladiella emersonii ATCC 22665]